MWQCACKEFNIVLSSVLCYIWKQQHLDVAKKSFEKLVMVLLSIVVWEQELVSEERSQLSSHHPSLHPCASPCAGTKCPCLWQQCLWGKEGVLRCLLCLWGSALAGCSLPGSSPAKLPSVAVGARRWHTSGSLGPKPRWTQDASACAAVITRLSSLRLSAFFQERQERPFPSPFTLYQAIKLFEKGARDFGSEKRELKWVEGDFTFLTLVWV